MILVSKEGVAQSGPLAMALFGIALLPLIEHLRAVYPDVLQTTLPYPGVDPVLLPASRSYAAQDPCTDTTPRLS